MASRQRSCKSYLFPPKTWYRAVGWIDVARIDRIVFFIEGIDICRTSLLCDCPDYEAVDGCNPAVGMKGACNRQQVSYPFTIFHMPVGINN